MRTTPSPTASGKIALRGLQRDGRRHDAREAVDVAADDHHGADLGRRAAEAREQDGDQREARIPQQRATRAIGPTCMA